MTVGVRGSPEQDILSLGAMGQGPGRFPALFACRRVRFCCFLGVHDFTKVGVRGSPERDILSLGAMGQGPGRFPGLFAYRVRFCRFFEIPMLS